MYNQKIKDEIEKIISEPTVLMCKDGEPIEYKNTETVRKIKLRTINTNQISPQLLMFVVDKGGSKNSLEKFSSGDFSHFLSLSKVYT